MKKKLLIIAILLIGNYLYSQVNSDCTPPSILISEYKKDVADLAIKRIFINCETSVNNISLFIT
ncbi:MAG: hypothetical protein U9Q98_12575 [Bacteroidota bacterium]|nr:hypothetical protein [Bacteroidota bacterium]